MKFISVDVSDVDQVHTVRNLRKRKFEFLMKHRPSYRSLLIEQNYPDIELESLKKKFYFDVNNKHSMKKATALRM